MKADAAVQKFFGSERAAVASCNGKSRGVELLAALRLPGRAMLAASLTAVCAGACVPESAGSAFPVAETDPASLADYARCDESQAGRPLDLTGAVPTFTEEFDRPSISGPDGDGPWFAPVHGGFGLARFLPPDSKEGPFFYSDGALTIRLAKRSGRWTSGIIQSVNAKGEGFSQRYGYFEMRAKFPKGAGTWPAFWLKTVNQFTEPSQTRAEIDIIEAYGANDWSGYHAAVHLWPARDRRPEQLQKHWYKGCYERVDGDLFDGDWHLYGGEVGPDWVIVYYERREIGRFPTLAEFRHPLFILADLALHDADPRTGDEPADMQIDYIRVWQRPAWSGRKQSQLSGAFERRGEGQLERPDPKGAPRDPAAPGLPDGSRPAQGETLTLASRRRPVTLAADLVA